MSRSQSSSLAATPAAPTMVANASTEPVLSIRHLSVAFNTEAGWKEVVHDLSFDLRARETLAIVGESGSGKSVTALSIARLLSRRNSRASGEIWLAGRNVLSLDEQAMRAVRGRDVGMIFQEPMTSLNPVMTVGAQIGEALRRHRGMDKATAAAEVMRLLERVRIPGAKRRMEDYPHNLSGGMRQRIMIAMALAGNPRVLVADEPTTALDVTVQAEILNLIKLLQDEDGMAVLFITHDMGVVAEISDRTVVMYQGRAVESGTTADIFASAEQPYTKLLLSAVPRLGSMAGATRPARFPLIDLTRGTCEEPREIRDTVKADTPVLEVDGLTVRFGQRTKAFEPARYVHAVENVSFTLRAGETLAIVGESGCGKSTTGRSIMRLIQPTSGSIRLDGEETMGKDRRCLQRLRRRVQMVFQDPYASLDPRMDVGSAIAEPLVAHGIASSAQARDIVASLLRRVGLNPDMATRYPHEFSGGQRQRICIARALALEPGTIVADECVSALDASTKAQVVNLMLDLQESLNVAYVFISHDMAVVERISHRVAVMYMGEIVEIGPGAAIFGNPQHAYTRKLLAAVPSADPSHRRRRTSLSAGEIPSVIHPRGYVPPTRQYRSVGDGHMVQV